MRPGVRGWLTVVVSLEAKHAVIKQALSPGPTYSPSESLESFHEIDQTRKKITRLG